MNNIQIKGINSHRSQAILKDIQERKQRLNHIFSNSDQVLIENLIEETEFLLEQAEDESRTYQEKSDIFRQLNESWFDVWGHYREIPEAIELIRTIDSFTNSSQAYYYFYLSLFLINEDRTGEYFEDLQRIVSGFLFLSEIVDVFMDLFSEEDLKQIHEGAKNAISISVRDVSEYFENGQDLSHLITQLRAYSSLIILKVGERIKGLDLNLESEVTQHKDKGQSTPSSKPWWEQIAGTFADDPAYDEAMKLGREYRKSLSLDSTEPSNS